jgi:hypothetical protein
VVGFEADDSQRGKVMSLRTAFFALAFLPIFLSSCAEVPLKKPVVESTTDLGFGFRRIVMAEPVESSSESIGHFEYLYYEDRRLCQVGACSVSPSGRYAIYQDGASGRLVVFSRADGKVTQLTGDFIAFADAFQWHEDVKTVTAHFLGGQRARAFALP